MCCDGTLYLREHHGSKIGMALTFFAFKPLCYWMGTIFGIHRKTRMLSLAWGLNDTTVAVAHFLLVYKNINHRSISEPENMGDKTDSSLLLDILHFVNHQPQQGFRI